MLPELAHVPVETTHGRKQASSEAQERNTCEDADQFARLHRATTPDPSHSRHLQLHQARVEAAIERDTVTVE